MKKIIPALLFSLMLATACSESGVVANQAAGQFTIRSSDEERFVSGVQFLSGDQEFSAPGYTNKTRNWPGIFFRSDSLCLYLPRNRQFNANVCVGLDSLRWIQHKAPDWMIADLRSSCIILMKPAFFETYDTLRGTIKCQDTISGIYDFYPFKVATH